MYIGDLFPLSTAHLPFESRDAAGALVTLVSPTAVVLRRSLIPGDLEDDAQSAAGLTINVDHGGIVGNCEVAVDQEADPDFYRDRCQFDVWLTGGTVGGTPVAGCVGSWSVGQWKDTPIRVPPSLAGYPVL